MAVKSLSLSTHQAKLYACEPRTRKSHPSPSPLASINQKCPTRFTRLCSRSIAPHRSHEPLGA
eukprot:5135578-Pleurochrysis_carterae.AAC.1